MAMVAAMGKRRKLAAPSSAGFFPCGHLPSSSSTSSALPKLHQDQEAPGHRHSRQPEEKEEEREPTAAPLLPGLPDHLAQRCLSALPPRLLYSLSRSARRLLYSPSFPAFLSLYAVLFDGATARGGAGAEFACFDPLSQEWRPLPPMPLSNPPALLTHPSFLSRRMPFQSVAAGGRLVVLAASTASLSPALARPMVFDPCSRSPGWIVGPEFPLSPRRWCVAGVAGSSVFLAAGAGASHDSEVARSAALWDTTGCPGHWARLPAMRDGRFSREPVEAVASNGKLCMVSVRGRGAKDGLVYDLQRSKWEEMPPGMLAGWTGPAAAMDGDVYVVAEESGAVRKYKWGGDRWETVVEASEMLVGAADVAAGGGRLCVATASGEDVVVVDLSCSPGSSPAAAGRGRIWTVAPPTGKRVHALHVLPRMSR